MQPTVRAVLVFTLGIPVALLPTLVDSRLWILWLAFLVAAVAALVADALAGVPRRGLTLEVVPPGVLYIGDADPLKLRLAAPGARRAFEVELLADLDALLQALPPRRVQVSGAAEVDLPLVPVRRGTAAVHAVWLRWQGPLGLVQRVVRHPLDLALPVVPDIRAVRAAALRSGAVQAQLAGLKEQRYVGDGSELESLHEYRAGLDHRAMDWKASARHRKLLVRRFRAERNHPVVLAFDTGHLMGEPLDGVPRLDHAINCGLLLAWYGLKAGDRVGLYAFDEQVRLFRAPVAGVQALHRLQIETAGLGYSPNETNFTLGVTHLAGRLVRRSLVVVLTDFVDTITADLMLENLERLARRHVVVFVSLRDPAPEAVAAAAPAALDDLHRAVAAADLVAERERVVRRLQRRGVLCVDAPPGQISAALVNRYLEVKRRELV